MLRPRSISGCNPFIHWHIMMCLSITVTPPLRDKFWIGSALTAVNTIYSSLAEVLKLLSVLIAYFWNISSLSRVDLRLGQFQRFCVLSILIIIRMLALWWVDWRHHVSFLAALIRFLLETHSIRTCSWLGHHNNHIRRLSPLVHCALAF